jgi:hypothetical protein
MSQRLSIDITRLKGNSQAPSAPNRSSCHDSLLPDGGPDCSLDSNHSQDELHGPNVSRAAAGI